MTKSYFACRWLHDFPDEPVDLYSELDEARFEVRKVYVFKDGHGEIAGPGIETGTTFIGEGAVPPLEEIAADPQFEPRVITRQEFEELWKTFGGG